MAIDNIIDEEEDVNRLELINRFCKEYGVRWINTTITIERGFREEMYIFSDDLGGYTIDGIKGSFK